jgi:hypothetical protein
VPANCGNAPPQVKAAALELVAQGLNDCEISRRFRSAFRDGRSWTGAAWTLSSPKRTWRVRINRRSSVALMLGNVGLKQ